MGPNPKVIPSNRPNVLPFKYLDPSLCTRHPVSIKKTLPRPVRRPRLAPFRSDPRRMHTRSRALAQMLTQECYDAHVNHLYNPVTGNKETYDTLRAQDLQKWETSFANAIRQRKQHILYSSCSNT